MSDAVQEISGHQVYVCGAEGEKLGSPQSALDLIGAAYWDEVDWFAVPVSRLTDDFLELRSGVAGEFLQKLINYEGRVAIMGDVSASVAASDALRDFIWESNRGNRAWFVADLDELADRLGRRRLT